MTSSEVLKLLRDSGWIVVRQCGSHVQLKKEGHWAVLTVPHPKKDVKIGLLKQIERIRQSK